jgi:UDP-glucose 4-epimerase
MRVLITGAGGFLGSHFAYHHLLAGDELVLLDIKPFADWSFYGKVAAGDYSVAILDNTDAYNYFHRKDSTFFDLAYHFAALVGGRERIEGDPLYNADSLRLDGEFFRWAPNRIQTAVYPSSSAVYGTQYQEHNADIALRETLFHPQMKTWPAPDEMYGFTKLVGEFLAWKSAGYGLSTLCIRPFSGFGEGQGFEYPTPSICRRALRREDPLTVWGSGYQSRDFIHVSDIVGATTARIDAGVYGYQSMNIGTGIETSFIDLARLAADIIGYDPVIETDASKPEGVSHRYCDPSEMLRHYRPRLDLRQGLARVLEDLRAQDNQA